MICDSQGKFFGSIYDHKMMIGLMRMNGQSFILFQNFFCFVFIIFTSVALLLQKFIRQSLSLRWNLMGKQSKKKRRKVPHKIPLQPILKSSILFGLMHFSLATSIKNHNKFSSTFLRHDLT